MGVSSGIPFVFGPHVGFFFFRGLRSVNFLGGGFLGMWLSYAQQRVIGMTFEAWRRRSASAQSASEAMSGYSATR